MEAVRQYVGFAPRYKAADYSDPALTPFRPPQKSSLLTKCLEQSDMAPSTRAYMRCFYCNKKSNRKYNAGLTQWECSSCESINYLDKNGQITEPPVASPWDSPPEAPSFRTMREAIASVKGPDSVFCEKCLKNQHMKVASLAQFHVEVDPKHPDYKSSEKALFKFQRDLNKRYPMVCDDCAPGAQARRDEADRIAKADWLGKLLQKSKSNQYPAGPKFTLSFSNVYLFIVKLLWYAGIIGQVLGNIAGLMVAFQINLTWVSEAIHLPDSSLPSNDVVQAALFLVRSKTWIGWSLFISIITAWWNPFWKQVASGFTHHIKGFADWYKYQFLVLIVRSLFYSIVDTGVLRDPISTATIIGHGFTLGFTLCIAFLIRRCLIIDMSPLWNSSPIRLSDSRPVTPEIGGNNMSSALDEIAGASNMKLQRNVSPIPSSYYRASSASQQPYKPLVDMWGPDRNKSANAFQPSYKPDYSYEKQKFEPQPRSRDGGLTQQQHHGNLFGNPPPTEKRPFENVSQSGINNGLANSGRASFNPSFSSGHQTFQPISSRLRQSTNNISLPQTPLAGMNAQEVQHYLRTGERPARLTQTAAEEQDLMDWSPTPAHQEFRPNNRSFDPPLDNQRSFGQPSAFDMPSPFYGHLPPAPITPAQRAFNPPTRPVMQAPSQERKDSFFQQMTKSRPFGQQSDDGEQATQERREFEFAQPKFFAPEVGTEGGNSLADMLVGFSISAEDSVSTANAKRMEKRSRVRHFLQGLSLTIGGSLWRYALPYAAEYARNVMIAVMLVSLVVAFGTVANNAKSKAVENVVAQSFWMIIGGLEIAASLYAIVELYGGRGDCENFMTLGTILVGGMTTQEFWFASFGH